jgi:hypothetical protein
MRQPSAPTRRAARAVPVAGGGDGAGTETEGARRTGGASRPRLAKGPSSNRWANALAPRGSAVTFKDAVSDGVTV